MIKSKLLTPLCIHPNSNFMGIGGSRPPRVLVATTLLLRHLHERAFYKSFARPRSTPPLWRSDCPNRRWTVFTARLLPHAFDKLTPVGLDTNSLIWSKACTKKDVSNRAKRVYKRLRMRYGNDTIRVDQARVNGSFIETVTRVFLSLHVTDPPRSRLPLSHSLSFRMHQTEKRNFRRHHVPVSNINRFISKNLRVHFRGRPHTVSSRHMQSRHVPSHAVALHCVLSRPVELHAVPCFWMRSVAFSRVLLHAFVCAPSCVVTLHRVLSRSVACFCVRSASWRLAVLRIDRASR